MAKGRITCLKRQLKYFEKQIKELGRKNAKREISEEINFYERYARWLKEQIKERQDNW